MRQTKSLKSRRHLVWMDLEMTGLDPGRERIIEMATVITDRDLQVVREGPDLVIHQSSRLLDRMDRWNQRQHKRSGLAEAVKRSKVSVEQAEALTLRFLKRYCYKGKSILCGNSVHHDRRFLIRYMPKLHSFLHYRLIDVSTVKTLAYYWYPKHKRFEKNASAHRAHQDILESIEELRFYRSTVFKKRKH